MDAHRSEFMGTRPSEKVDDTPKIHARNLNASRLVLEEHGNEFLDLNGVRLPRPAMEAGRE